MTGWSLSSRHVLYRLRLLPVQRILLLKEGGDSVDKIADKVGLNRNSVLLCLRKYKQGGIENAIYDAPGRGRNAEITDDEKAWTYKYCLSKTS